MAGRVCVILLGLLVQFARGGVNPFEPDIKPQLGQVCAFGDVNGDRLTDILVYRRGDQDIRELAWLLQKEQGSFENGTVIHLLGVEDTDTVPKCSVGDFDGKSSLDVLVSLKTKGGGFKQYLYLNTDYTSTPFSLVETARDELKTEPSLWDINGDGLSDIVGFSSSDGKLYCRLGTENSGDSQCEHHFKDASQHLSGYSPFPGMPHMFFDVDGDLSAEIIFLLEKAGRLHFQVWKRGDDHSSWKMVPGLIPALPDEFQYFAAPVIGDFDGDMHMEIALPVCKENECQTVTHFLIWEAEQRPPQTSWEQYSIDMNDLTLVRDGDSRVLFRVGDFTLDGFPDLVATFKQKTSQKTYTRIIDNDECKDCGGKTTRRFNIRRGAHFIEPWESALGNVTLSTFFDLKEDGNLDILVEYVYSSKTKFSFILSDEKGDTTFLKVQTYTNVCDDRNCRKGKSGTTKNDIGSGIAWPGVCVKFEMTDSWSSGKKEGVSCQLPFSTHRALSTPYVLFGLGRSPNFVDQIVVGSPRMPTEEKAHSNQKGVFKQLVPNSRVIVIPPKGSGTHWQSRLFVTPSQLIIQSLIVLASVCLLLLLVVIILHVREKKEDRVERQAQSHRFHFDAM